MKLDPKTKYGYTREKPVPLIVANPTLSPHLERVAAVLECQISVLLIILRREVNVSAWKADSSPTAGAWKGDARQHAGDDHCRKARRDVNLL